MEDSPEIREARRALANLSSGRKQQEKRPDFATVDMNDVVPGFNEAANADPLDGWHSCLKCRREIKRLEYPDPFKRPGRFFRPMPTCPCIIEEGERRRAWEERLERKRRLQRTYARNIMAAAIVDARLEEGENGRAFNTRPGTEKAFEKALEFCRTFEGRKTGLLFFGTVGNGKSHLARGIEYRLDAEGWATLFLDWPQLVELAKSTFNKNSNVTISDYVRAALDADLLVLDELGAGPLTSFEFKELLFPILNGRSGKATVYTTNLDPERLANWFNFDKEGRPLDEDGRLIDRIIGGCEIVINRGTSKRREDAMRRIEG